MKKYFLVFLLTISMVTPTIECNFVNIHINMPHIFNQWKESFQNRFIRKKEHKNANTFAIGATGIIAGAILYSCASQFPSSPGYYRDGNQPRILKKHLIYSGKATALLGVIGALIYRIVESGN